MNIAVASLLRSLTVAFPAALMIACGGGGGDSQAAGQPAVESPASSTPLTLTADNQRPALTVTSIYAESVLALALDTTDWIRSFALAAAPSATNACVASGSRTWAWTDSNRNALVDNGDLLTLTLADCGAPASAVLLTGSVSITLQPAPSPDALAARLAIGPGGLSFAAGDFTFAWKGQLRLERSVSPVQDRLAVQAVAADGLKVELRGAGVAANDRFEALSLSRVSDNDYQAVMTEMSLTVASDVLQGRVNLATTIPFFAYFDTYPIEGDLEAFANGRVLLRARHDGAKAGTFFVLEGDQSGSGLPMLWSELMAGLAWVGPGGPLPERYARVQEVPAVAFAFIAGSPAAVDPTTRRLDLQLNRQPVLGGPVASRLQRVGDGWGPASIDARLEVRATRLELMWNAQLEPGRTYRVEVFDAATMQPVELRDRGDAAASVLAMPDLVVADSLSATIETEDRLRLLPGLPVRLQAKIAGPTGSVAPIRYNWRQTAGSTAVQMSTTDQAAIEVSIQAASGTAPNEVTLELEVTDARGVVDRQTVVLTAIASPATSWIVQMDGSPGDPYLNGTRLFSAYAEPTRPAETVVRWADANPTPYIRAVAGFSSGISQSAFYFLALPLGAPLQPGTYQAPVSLFYRVSTAAMHLGTDRNSTICQSLDATFTIHEVQLGASDGSSDGTPVERLALDYVYSCEGAPAVRGALRLRSAVPLPP